MNAPRGTLVVSLLLIWIAGTSLPLREAAADDRAKRIRAVVYPAPGQRKVPRVMSGDLVPDPLPLTKEKVGGYPVTVDFIDAKEVAGASIAITDGAGVAVPAWVSSPRQPANPKYPGFQKREVWAIAKDALAPGAWYRVSARATVDGVPWSKQWSFRTAEEDEAGAARECKLLLEGINARRRQLRLPPLTVEPRVSAACREHARYLSVYMDSYPHVPNLSQRLSLRYATPNGMRIAPSCVPLYLHAGLPDATTEAFVSPTCRDPLLDPRLTKIGVACDALRGRNKVLVWYGVPSPLVSHPGPVVYPPQGATGIPIRSFNQAYYEQWGFGDLQDAGYPAAVLFPPGSKVEGHGAVMYTADDNKEVDCWNAYYPRVLADGLVAQVNTLVPKRPLRPKTAYTVTFTATINGKPWEHESTFTTGSPPASLGRAAVEVVVLRSLNRHREAAGLGPVTVDAALSAGCARHAEYVRASKDKAIRTTLSVHDEDPKDANYSKEGQAAARSSVVLFATSSAEHWVDAWMDCPYHRPTLLNPDLKRIGVGYASERNPDKGWIAVVDVLRGVRR